jgi:hypothetical protein
MDWEVGAGSCAETRSYNRSGATLRSVACLAGQHPIAFTGSATMKSRFAPLLFLAIALMLCGCSTTEEDAAFFETGWVRPEAGANERLQLSPAGGPKPPPPDQEP